MPPTGLSLVLDALTFFSNVRKEQFRFQTLMQALREDSPIEFQVPPDCFSVTTKVDSN